MDLLQAVTVASMLAKEIRQAIQDNKDISQDELTKLIASNLMTINSIVDTIKSEMEQYKE